MKLKNILKLVIFILIMLYVFGFSAHLLWGHTGGHADGIEHLTGKTTPTTARANYYECTGQNKILSYYDLNKDGIFDLCITIWQEHSKLHIIKSIPDKNQHCECEGYLWLDNDTQETR